jgi:signal transduction histidine kinase
MIMQKLRPVTDYWYQRLIAPRSHSPDDRRRELILNILLCGLIGISLLGDAATIATHLHGNVPDPANSLAPVLAFTLVLIGLWIMSRKNRWRFSSYIILSFLLLVATQLTLMWSFELPGAQMTFTILLVLSGVLLSARTALKVTFGLAVYVLLISYGQVSGQLHPNTGWLDERAVFGDSVGFVAGLLIIGLVSWLANREIDRSLDRARRSEAALEIERDQLEVKVVERTRELEQAQLTRVMELQRLAEFGRMSAGLLHDVANPLTAASLNLKQLGITSRSSVPLRQALQSLHYIERFLEAARKQLKSQSSTTNFTVYKEVEQVMSILAHRARESGVSLKLHSKPRYKLYGDPVKFNQIVANLILNAIEAYDDSVPSARARRVLIDLEQGRQELKLTVTDYGQGLNQDQIENIFEPFYSTKSPNEPNMGIGLLIAKQRVEADFHGRIKVSSSPRHGTRFTVYLQNQAKDGN